MTSYECRMEQVTISHQFSSLCESSTMDLPSCFGDFSTERTDGAFESPRSVNRRDRLLATHRSHQRRRLPRQRSVILSALSRRLGRSTKYSGRHEISTIPRRRTTRLLRFPYESRRAHSLNVRVHYFFFRKKVSQPAARLHGQSSRCSLTNGPAPRGQRPPTGFVYAISYTRNRLNVLARLRQCRRWRSRNGTF